MQSALKPLRDWLGAQGGKVKVVVAILTSLQPAWKASRLDPINALRHV